MATLTTPARTKSSTQVREPKETQNATLLGKQPVAVASAVARPVAVATPARRASSLTIMARLMVAFYDWLSGPGMSQRDRDQRELADARNYLRGTRSGR